MTRRSTRLKKAGVLYACYETPEELDLRRKIRRTRGLPPVYGREALALTARRRSPSIEADGRRPHWRFLLPNFRDDPFETERTEVTWTDLVRGEETVDLASLSDPVLVREDGTFLYTLPSVVDDIDMGISHVIRGDDHVTNTGVQIALFKALGAEPPAFGHHNLLTTASGEGAVEAQRRAFDRRPARIRPRADGGSLARRSGRHVGKCRGRSHAWRNLPNASTSAATSKSAVEIRSGRSDRAQPRAAAPNAVFEARDRLAALGISGDQAEPFWLAVRGNLEKLADARQLVAHPSAGTG